MKKSLTAFLMGMFLSISVLTIVAFAESPIEGISDEAYEIGLELMNQFSKEEYREDLGEKFKNMVTEQFNNEIDNLTSEEIADTVNKEEYVQDTLEKIAQIGVSGKQEDIDLMTDIFAIYMLTLDNAWARGPEGGEHPCSNTYRLLLLFSGMSEEDQEKLMDLDTLIEFFGDTYVNSSDMSGIEYALSLSNLSMFHPEQINLIQ